MTPRHGARDEATGKPFALQRSGHCQTGGCATCRWFPRYETPSVIIVCTCECHTEATETRVMKPKGEVVRKLVAKS